MRLITLISKVIIIVSQYDKKLSYRYRRGTARGAVSVKILSPLLIPIAVRKT